MRCSVLRLLTSALLLAPKIATAPATSDDLSEVLHADVLSGPSTECLVAVDNDDDACFDEWAAMLENQGLVDTFNQKWSSNLPPRITAHLGYDVNMTAVDITSFSDSRLSLAHKPIKPEQVNPVCCVHCRMNKVNGALCKRVAWILPLIHIWCERWKHECCVTTFAHHRVCQCQCEGRDSCVKWAETHNNGNKCPLPNEEHWWNPNHPRDPYDYK